MLLRTLLLLLLAVAGFSANSDLGLGPAPVTSAAPSGAAGGDLAGTYPNPTVTAARFSTPGAVGDGTPSTGAFTTLSGSTSITDAGLTATRVTFAGTAGLLSDDAGLTYASASDLLVVNHNAAAAPTAPTGTQLQVLGIDATSGVVAIDTGAAQASFLGRRANTSIGSPSALVNNDTIVQLAAQGYGASAYTTSARGIVRVVATETWTDAAMGTRLEFLTTANTTLTTATRLTITGASATFATGVPVAISDTTASTTTAGALLIGTGTAATTVTFGGGNGNVGGTLAVAGALTDTLTTDSTSITTGSVILSGGLGVAKRITLDGATGKTLRITNINANASVAVTLGSTGCTGTTAGAPQGWMRIDINGTDRFMPFWAWVVCDTEWRESEREHANGYPARFITASRPFERAMELQ